MRIRALAIFSSFFIVGVAAAQEPARPVERPSAEGAAPEGNRKRWEQLPPEQQKRIEKLYERLKELPPEKRKLLLERLRATDPAARQAALERAKRDLDKDTIERDMERERRRFVEAELRKLPPEEQERLKKLSPEEKQRWVASKIDERRERLRSKLPPQLRERLEKLPPREQNQELQRLQGERLFHQTFTDPKEVEAIRAIGPRKVLDALRSATSASPPQKPEWMSDATWTRWLQLKPFERPRALRHLFNSRTDASRPEPGAAEKRRKKAP
jgi:hypothetical protein